jgi:tetratricopeptide (TPR) repeat protein/transcriptional regulator with XRE-family HTH domain
MIPTDIDLFSFGQLLKTFRKRQRLTQLKLAEVIGVHRSTLLNWEQGNFLPDSKTMVLELARHLHLDDQETRQLLEASLTALSPHWLVPLPRNPFFTGRGEILEVLRAQLGVDRAVAHTQSAALHGLGGVGKTQVALEYAYRHALEYSAVFWIGAETEESMVTSLLHIAEVLQLPERADKDQQRVVTAVQRWLSIHGQWLLVWDNVEDFELFQRFLPATRSGAILLTTRHQVLGTLAQGLDLLPMGQEEGILFLLRRAKMLKPEATIDEVHQLATQGPAQFAAALELVTILGTLPLALDQAGAYLEETRCGLPTYLDLFRTRRAILLQQRGKGSHNHPASVSTTFTLAITAITQHYPAVLDLLRVCAQLHPDAIPEELFHQGAEYLGVALQTVCRDKFEWNKVVAVACGYSLLERQPEQQTLSIHRLVRSVLLDAMNDEEQTLWSTRVTTMIDAALPEVKQITEYAVWKQCESLLPHILVCLQQEGDVSVWPPLASLAYKTACYLLKRGQHLEAERLFQRALQIWEKVLGSEHPNVANSLNYLAILSLNQGKYAQAERLFQRALQIAEQTLGPEHPNVAVSLHDLAVLLQEQGKYTVAEPLAQRALQIREKVLGSEHPVVATSLNDLGDLFREQGRYAEAELLMQRGLQIREKALGLEHLTVFDSLNSLANLYRDQGRYPKAEPLYQRALQIAEQTLGPDHPRVAILLSDLAECSRRQSKDMVAERLFQRALQIAEQTLGPEHPYVSVPLNGLANISRDRSHYLEAEQFYQRALLLREHHPGQHHPELAEILHDLALFRQKQGDLSEGFSYAERALHIRLKVLGDAHPKTITTRTLHTQLHQVAATKKSFSDQEMVMMADTDRKERQAGESVLPPHNNIDTLTITNDPLQGFLEVLCEVHSRAWCRSANLWQAYLHWAKEQHERYPLTRGAFIAQLKVHGFFADRTRSARIWRGITLVNKQQ